MSTDLLWDLTVLAVNGHTNIILKTDIYNSYARIHPHRMTASHSLLRIYILDILCLWII